MHEIPERRRWRGDFWDIVMNVVQIVGMAGTMVLLKQFTSLPFWACFLIGIPLFFVVFLGSIYILFGRRHGGRGRR